MLVFLELWFFLWSFWLLIKSTIYGKTNSSISRYNDYTIKFIHHFGNIIDFNLDPESKKAFFDEGYECVRSQHSVIERFVSEISILSDSESEDDDSVMSDDSYINTKPCNELEIHRIINDANELSANDSETKSTD